MNLAIHTDLLGKLKSDSDLWEKITGAKVGIYAWDERTLVLAGAHFNKIDTAYCWCYPIIEKVPHNGHEDEVVIHQRCADGFEPPSEPSHHDPGGTESVAL